MELSYQHVSSISRCREDSAYTNTATRVQHSTTVFSPLSTRSSQHNPPPIAPAECSTTLSESSTFAPLSPYPPSPSPLASILKAPVVVTAVYSYFHLPHRLCQLPPKRLGLRVASDLMSIVHDSFFRSEPALQNVSRVFLTPLQPLLSQPVCQAYLVIFTSTFAFACDLECIYPMAVLRAAQVPFVNANAIQRLYFDECSSLREALA